MALAVVASRVLRANAEKSLRLDGYPPPDVGVLGSSLGGFLGYLSHSWNPTVEQSFYPQEGGFLQALVILQPRHVGCNKGCTFLPDA